MRKGERHKTGQGNERGRGERHKTGRRIIEKLEVAFLVMAKNLQSIACIYCSTHTVICVGVLYWNYGNLLKLMTSC